MSRPSEIVTAVYLTAVRHAKGISQWQAARAAGLSLRALRRLEEGGAVDPGTAADLMRVYGFTAESGIDAVRSLLDPRAGCGSMRLDEGAGNRDRLTAWEQAAHRIRMWSAMLIPDLLQTPAYAKAVVRHARLYFVPGQVPLGLRGLSADGPRVSLLLDEAVLERPVGGYAVMAGQLRHLCQLIRCGAATVRIVPFESRVLGPGDHLAELHLRRRPCLVVDEAIGIHYVDTCEGRTQLQASLDEVEAAAVPARESYQWLVRAQASFDAHRA
ncbi:helix-turn-helix transcriptional regulator [Streptomyces sp. NPDC098789]|uniref:helix-turn-helix domain-containing protein n=1 Tax=Streptomyces sp. NPDC098789 TaxID=3366098 RepID=UPI0038035674